MWYTYALVGIIVLSVVGRVVAVELHRRRRERQPEYTENAMVVGKRWTQENVGRGDTRDGGQVWLVTFETESGTVAELTVGRSTYARLAKGNRGVLTWQGDRCLNFEVE